MEAEEFMKLFDSLWFGLPKVENPSTAMLMLEKVLDCLMLGSPKVETPSTAMLMLKKLDEIEWQQTSDRSCFKMKAASMRNLPEMEQSPSKKQQCSCRGKQQRLSRSLSAIEFQELKKGFIMDLGLQKTADEDDEICRPYLSEAWGVLNGRESSGGGGGGDSMNWKIMKNEVAMKDQLRFWARIVASNVK